MQRCSSGGSPKGTGSRDPGASGERVFQAVGLPVQAGHRSDQTGEAMAALGHMGSLVTAVSLEWKEWREGARAAMRHLKNSVLKWTRAVSECGSKGRFYL